MHEENQTSSYSLYEYLNLNSMQENIEILERIESHILSQMNDEEKASFEKELSSDPELRKEYELQKEIILAVQRVHFKQYLRNVEHGLKLKRKRIIRRVSSWSVAAAILCVCMIGLDLKVSSDLTNMSGQYYAETVVIPSRDGNDIGRILENIHECIGSNDLTTVKDSILFAESLIAEDFKTEVTNAEEEYQRCILLTQSQELEWYKALILMKEGKVFKSRKALKQIALSESRYAEKAKNIIESIYKF